MSFVSANPAALIGWIPNTPRKWLMLFRSRIGALILIIVGTLFLLSNLGWIPRIGPFLHQWWPLILILVGVLMLVRRS